MKILVVAHPDDEILWFNPQSFDKIIICFLFRRDKHWDDSQAIYNVLKEHPLKDKIICLGLTNGKLWQEPKELEKFADDCNENILRELLKKQLEKAGTVYTHNAWGEYGHSDHKLVHKVVKEVAPGSVFCFNGIKFDDNLGGDVELIDINLYNSVKELYRRKGVWTWHEDYLPIRKQFYFKVK